MQPEVALFSPASSIAEAPSRNAFMRGLTLGLALGLTFWTLLAVEIVAR
jgi:hypothetical protein